MLSCRKSLHLLMLSLVAVSVVSFTGCSSFLFSIETEGEKTAIAPGTPHCVVQMQGEGWKKTKQIQQPISENMTIDQLLDAIKAKQKFRNMEIDIFRQIPNGGGVHKMAVNFRASNKNVSPEHDYAIHPNDQIIIRQVVDTPLDNFVDTMFPPANR